MTTPNATETQKYPVQIVSLGPGDPDTVTIKSHRILRSSDCIFCPYTQTRHGRISRTAGMLAELDVPQTAVVPFEVPMSKDRSRTVELYRELAENIEREALNGKKVVLTVEGDAGVFSSSQFISDLLSERGIAVERTEGIPAFVACAARINLPLILKDEELMVTSGDKLTPDTVSAVLGGRTVVVMKPSLDEQGIKEIIRTLPGNYVHYFENIGMTGTEYTSSDKEEILRRPFPYFSILIFRKG